MPKGRVFQGILGIKRNTNSWGGAALACGALDGIKVLASPLQGNRQLIANMSIQGRSTQSKSDKGNLIIQGDVLSAELAYEGFERVIAGVMGTAGAPTTVDTNARLHKFRIKDALEWWWTLAYEIVKDTLIYEFNTVLLTGFTIKASQGGRWEITVRGIGHDFSDASAINTTTTIDNITVPANSVQAALFRHLVLRLNDESAGALGASDVRYISGFEINVDRNLQLDFTSEFGDRTSMPISPANGDVFTKVTGSITFSQLDTASPGGSTGLPAKQLSGTSQKIDVVSTGDNLAGAATQKYQMNLYLPSLQMGDGKPAFGNLGWTVPFTANHVTTAPTGFDALDVDALTIWMYSQRTTDALT
jgi:hypothetical protein